MPKDTIPDVKIEPIETQPYVPHELRNAPSDSFTLYQLRAGTENRELRFLPLSELREQAQEFRNRVHTVTEDIEQEPFRSKRQVEACLRDKGFDVKPCTEPDRIIVCDDMQHRSDFLLQYCVGFCRVDGCDTRALDTLVDGSRYECVYTGPLPDECAGITDQGSILETIYYRMNMKHPAGYLAASMSTSDVVALTMSNETKYFYTDSIGFQPLTDFHPMENSLRNAEMAMEDDFDMIDGINPEEKVIPKSVSRSLWKSR